MFESIFSLIIDPGPTMQFEPINTPGIVFTFAPINDFFPSTKPKDLRCMLLKKKNLTMA